MVFYHSLFCFFSSACEKAEIKKAMGARKPPMALTFNLCLYNHSGQTSLSMFAQHHQLLILEKCFTCLLFIQI